MTRCRRACRGPHLWVCPSPPVASGPASVGPALPSHPFSRLVAVCPRSAVSHSRQPHHQDPPLRCRRITHAISGDSQGTTGSSSATAARTAARTRSPLCDVPQPTPQAALARAAGHEEHTMPSDHHHSTGSGRDRSELSGGSRRSAASTDGRHTILCVLPDTDPVSRAPARRSCRSIGTPYSLDALETSGLHVIYLGIDVPVDPLIQAIAAYQPTLTGLSLTMPRPPGQIQALADAINTAHHSHVLIGGQGVP